MTASVRGAKVVRGMVLATVPAAIYVANLFLGAALPIPALVFFAVTSATLLTALANADARADLARMTPIAAPAILFATTIAVALLSLSDLTPGGGHPIWAWAGFPSASSLNLSATILEIIKLFGLATVFLLGCLLGARTGRGREALWLILVLGALYGFTSLLLYLADPRLMRNAMRFTAGFATPNVAGTQFGVLLVLGVAWAFRKWRTLQGRSPAECVSGMAVVAAPVLVFLVCLLMTASRGAMAATGLSLCLVGAWEAIESRRSRWSLVAAGVGLTAVAATVAFQGNQLFLDRFGDLRAGQGIRAQVFEAHWHAFLASPLFGYGLGSFSEVNDQIATIANTRSLAVSVVLHNAYLQWLVEAGVVGSAPFFILIALILGTTSWRTARRAHNRTIMVGLLAASLLVLVHATVDVSLNTPSFEAFWALLLGLGFALSQAPSGRRSG